MPKFTKYHPDKVRADYVYSRLYYFLFVTLVFVAAAGILTGDLLVLGIALFFVFFLFLNRYYLVYAAKALSWAMAFSYKSVFPDDDNSLFIYLKNSRFFPILHSQWHIQLNDPENAVEFIEDGVHYPSSRGSKRSFQLKSGTTNKFTLPLAAVKRGPVTISSLEIIVYDLFQLSYAKLHISTPLSVKTMVYPKLTPAPALPFKSKQGNEPAANPYALNEDVYVRSSRQYQFGDPFNRINWKQSARRQELYTKELEKINQPEWAIVINLNHPSHPLQLTKHLEEIVSEAAFMCQHAVEKQLPFNLITNQKTLGNSSGMPLGYGHGQEHLRRAFAMLASIRRLNMTVVPENILQSLLHSRRIPRCIFHFGHVTGRMEEQYALLKQRGTDVQFIPPPAERTG